MPQVRGAMPSELGPIPGSPQSALSAGMFQGGDDAPQGDVADQQREVSRQLGSIQRQLNSQLEMAAGIARQFPQSSGESSRQIADLTAQLKTAWTRMVMDVIKQNQPAPTPQVQQSGSMLG